MALAQGTFMLLQRGDQFDEVILGARVDREDCDWHVRLFFIVIGSQEALELSLPSTEKAERDAVLASSAPLQSVNRTLKWPAP